MKNKIFFILISIFLFIDKVFWIEIDTGFTWGIKTYYINLDYINFPLSILLWILVYLLLYWKISNKLLKIIVSLFSIIIFNIILYVWDDLFSDFIWF